jgi:hypothetical protein
MKPYFSIYSIYFEEGFENFTVVPIEVLSFQLKLKYWFNTLPGADQLISSSSSRYLYTS